MKKEINIIFFVLLIHMCSNEENDTFCQGSAFTSSDCFTQSNSNGTDSQIHCCFFKARYKDDTSMTKQCVNLTNENYSSIDKVIKDYENNYDEVSIYCSSTFLNYGILFITFLFFNII